MPKNKKTGLLTYYRAYDKETSLINVPVGCVTGIPCLKDAQIDSKTRVISPG